MFYCLKLSLSIFNNILFVINKIYDTERLFKYNFTFLRINYYHGYLFSLTTSLKSLYKSFNRYPTKSPNSHLPIFKPALNLTISSTFLSSSLAMIYPATFLQFGLAISSFIPSIKPYSFCNVSLIFVRSPASFSY